MAPSCRRRLQALCWAVGRGALCMQHFTLPQFLAVYWTPITPAVSAPRPGTPAAAAKARSVAKAAANGRSSNSSSAAGGVHAGKSDGGSHAGTGLPRRGSQGRLGEDAGGPGDMVAAFLGKHVFVLLLIYLLQFDLPGLVESFVCGELPWCCCRHEQRATADFDCLLCLVLLFLAMCCSIHNAHAHLCLPPGLALYALLSLIMDGPAALVIGATGLRVSPHFDRPWRSTSVASFWSKRWDLAAGNTLRQLVYESVVDGSLMAPPAGVPPARPSPARQALGTAATFAASGLIHEAIFW